MAAALSEAFVRLRVDGSQLKPEAARAIDQVDGDAAGKKVGTKFSKGVASSLRSHAAVIGGALAAAAALKFGKDAVANASLAEQSLGATETVFGKFSGAVVKSSGTASTAFGLSANEYRENANVIGSLLKNQGVSAQQLAGKTGDLIKKGSDLSAVFGGSTKDAVDALASSLKGEFDPLERYGISLKQSTINSKAMSIAGVNSVSAFNKLTPAAQKAATQQATLALIQQQSAATSGQFAAQTGTTAEQVQIAKAKYTDLTAQLGAKLLPVMNVLLSVGSSVLTFFSQYGSVIVPVVAVLGTLAGIVWAVITAQKAWVAVQAALNIVMSANPIGLIILGIVALVAVIIIAWKRSETFRNIVTGAFNAVKGAAMTVVNWIKANWPLLLAILTGPVGLAVKWIIDHWGGIVTFFKGIPGKIGKVIGGVVGVLTSPFRSAFNAIADLWNGTVGQLSFHVPDWVPGIGGKGFSMPKLPHLAVGTDNWMGGFAHINERGPETVWLPAGSKVTPHGKSPAAMRGGDTTQVIQLQVDGRTLAEVLVGPLGQVIQNRPA